MKVQIGKFWYRLKVATKILCNPKLRWIFISIDEEGFRALLTGSSDVEANMSYHRMQEYNMWHLIQSLGSTKDDIDMMLMKAEFEAKAQEYAERDKTNTPPAPQ